MALALPNLINHERFLNKDLKINFIGRLESKKLEYRDLTGPDKIKLFQNIEITDLIPSRGILMKNMLMFKPCGMTFFYYSEVEA